MAIKVEHDAQVGRYEVVEGGDVLGLLTYERTQSTVGLTHTVVHPDHRGRGLASAMTEQVFRDAREHGMRIEVICPFVEHWLGAHPEYEDLVIRG